MSQLRTSLQIHKLAKDLGIRVGKDDDPVGAIVNHCERQIKSMMAGLTDCETLSQMLDWIANKAGTYFEIIQSDEDLQRIKQNYLDRREVAFARLEEEFSDDVFGVTFKLHHREPWEPQYVSVIDCRGEKAARAYFTKWHEIAHLLTQTEQMRLVFRRTHSAKNSGDPEERLMDVIAARFGFYPEFVQRFIGEGISFEAIEKLRERLCPEASYQSSLINFVKCWNSPCILLHAEMGLRKGEEAKLVQGGFFFADVPQQSLRAVNVAPNDLARARGFAIYENMRVPERSVIHRVFAGEIICGEAEEDLSWWEASSGKSLKPCRVKVQARWWMQYVEALITPIA
jgi:hypothetical protein